MWGTILVSAIVALAAVAWHAFYSAPIEDDDPDGYGGGYD